MNPLLETPELQRVVEEAVRFVQGRHPGGALDALPRDVILGEIDETLRGLMGPALAGSVKDALLREIESRLTGFGVLDKLLAEPDISDIMVNGTENIFVERQGRLEETSLRFQSEDELRRVISRMLGRVGREIDPEVPMVDVPLADGSRANIVLPPLSVDGPVISIRRFGRHVVTGEDLVRQGSMPPELLDFFSLVVKGRLNILVVGGTGTGKTTLLNVLSSFIPNGERIITIEDVAELQLRQRHVVRLETKPGIGGRGEVTTRDLFRNSLRMRPDRILVGEVRGAEVLDMLQAMNTGHEGSMTTLHANSPRDALLRIEALIRMSGLELPETALAQSLSRSFHLVVHLARLSDGRRVVQSVQEIVGRESNVITMHELFTFQQRGVDEQGRVIGQFRSTGVRPQFYDRLRRTTGRGGP